MQKVLILKISFNHLSFVFDERNRVWYQITNMVIESEKVWKEFPDMNRERALIDPQDQSGNSKLGGEEGVCPVGPWKMRPEDGCCVSVPEIAGKSNISRQTAGTCRQGAGSCGQLPASCLQLLKACF